jgi:predicted amidohydrolase YtcJ
MRFARLKAATVVMAMIPGAWVTAQTKAAPAAETILYDAKVWTVDPAKPEAEAVAIAGGRIVRVGSTAEVMRLKGAKTKMIDLHGETLLPGFNDAHTHFENAVQWYFEARIQDVDSEALLVQRVRETAARIPKNPNLWIQSGGVWSASKGLKSVSMHMKDPKNTLYPSFEPSLADMDAAAGDHPLYLQRYDGAAFINSRAIAIARILDTTPDPAGGRYGHDANGHLNGMLYGTTAAIVANMLPPMTMAQKVLGAAGVVKQMNAYGLTSIHDIARSDEVTQTQIYRSSAERSYSDTNIYKNLRKQGGLTIRVYAFEALQSWSELKKFGITPGSGDDMIRYGVLKDFTDGSLMFKPMNNEPNFSGNWTYRFPGEDVMQKNILDADKAGWDVALHIIGDKSLHESLGWYEKAYEANPRKDRRFRLIHVWFATPEDLKKAGEMHLIADITPYQLTGDMDGLESDLGPERAKYAWAWRTMMNDGVKLDIVSDMPGLYSRLDVGPYDPIENIYYATTRQNLAGEPAGGFHPEQCFTVKEAIEAYTANPAWASHEEKIKGTITPGKLADLVAVSGDLLDAKGKEILQSKVTMTMLGGKIVYERPGK